MASINNVTISGNLARDPEVKFLPSGMAVCEFSIAVSDYYKPKDGEGKEIAYFFDCKSWGKQGEVIAKHFAKGKPIAVSGKLVQETWEKDGQKRSKVLVNVDTFIFCGGEKRSGDAPPKSNAPAKDPDLDPAEQDDIPF